MTQSVNARVPIQDCLFKNISPACHTCVLQSPLQYGGPHCAHYLQRSNELLWPGLPLFTWHPSMSGQSVRNSHLGADVLSVSGVVVEVTLHITLARHDSGNATTVLSLCSSCFPSLSSGIYIYISLFFWQLSPHLRCKHMKNVISSLKKYTYNVSYLDICYMDANYQ